MTIEQWAAAVTLIAIGVAALVFGAKQAWRLWRRWQARDRDPDPVIAGLISEKGAKIKHAGFDPMARAQATKRRERAERARAKANQIASTPTPTSKPRPVVDNVRPMKRRA